MSKITNLTKSYEGFSVKDISFSVSPGEAIALVGKSGSGKSTLLRLLAGLEQKDAGEINFDGKIAYVSQDYTLFPHLTLIENITLLPKLRGEKSYKETAVTYLKEFELYEHRNKYPNELSGGQRQRTALIRALMINARVFLLDEVTSALDPEATKNILEMVQKLKEEDYQVIFATHELGFAERGADRVMFLDEGDLYKDISVDSFFNQEDDSKIKTFVENYYF